MAGESPTADETGVEPSRGLSRSLGAVAPLVLLALLVALVVAFPPFAGVQTGEPLPDVTVTHATVPNEGTISLHVVNSGPQSVSIAQVHVNGAYWDYAGNSETEWPVTLAPLESATITVPYHVNPGWDLEVDLVLSDGTTIGHTIVAPQVTPALNGELLGTLALVGLLVGVVPVVLGMLWYPFMRDLPRKWLHAVLALAGGVLAFLAVDAGLEAFELAGAVPGAYEGEVLVVLGVLGTLLLIQAIAESFGDGDLRPLAVAYLVALSIGLHNLAEGLAIGGAVAQGHVSLGAFLVIGFMVHNVTEGPAVVAPVAREERPALWHFAAMGLIAGAPVILGGWIGSIALSPTLGALFLAIGVGAILQVEWEMASMVRQQGGEVVNAANLLAFLAGLAIMYATDLLVSL